jgi:PKD repeat protein
MRDRQPSTGRVEARSSHRWASLATVAALAVTGFGFGAITAPAASAAPGVVQTSAAGMVTADPLPTVQVNGVVWSQAVVGTKVFAGGSFSQARPAGAAAGTNETPRSNLLAYDITTGALDAGFAPVLNGQVRSVVASPDGKRVYVAGDFTTINGGTRSRIAAFDTATGKLITNFLASADYNVYSVAATDSTVYIGGDFNNARGVARAKLAAFNISGDLLGWNPGADKKVNALVLTPDGSKVVAGGAFLTLAGQTVYGNGAVDAATGAASTWKANGLIRNWGDQAAILGLSTDGTAVYANGYVYGKNGNLEGVYSANPSDGSINWVEDCHGDSYGTYAPGNATDAVYVVSHAHYCGNVGGHPQTDPWTFQRGMAFTKRVTGTLGADPYGYYNYAGTPSPSVVSWFPQLAAGTYTGQSQAAWTVTGNDQYIVLGGEFPSVNGVAQQGLVRFAVQPIGKSTRPIYSGGNLVPTVTDVGGGVVRVAVTANWDRDDSRLTYELLRDGKVVRTVTADSTFWNRPAVTVLDGGLTAGRTYKYQIRSTDPAGNAAVGNPVMFAASANSPASTSPYVQQVTSQGASAFWRFGETTGPVYDWAGNNDGTAGSGVTRGAAGAIAGEADTAATLNGTDNGRVSTATSLSGPSTFTTQAWIRTTSTRGGKILGFGNSATGTSSSYDRHLYMDNSGKILFGVYPGAVKTVRTTNSYNDGQWHQVVGTLGQGGLTLYVDGVKIATDPTVTGAQNYSGYWKIGGDNLNGWTNQPSSANFAGTVDDVSIYPTQLTDQQVADQFKAAGGLLPNVAPTAAFTSSVTGSTVGFDGRGSTDSDGTIAGYAWDFGDGSTGTGAQPSHTYAAPGTFQVKLTVTDDRSGTNAVTQSVTIVPNQPPVAAFTVTADHLALAVDGATSTDPDGTIAGYAWDFGDGSTGTGPTASHTYGAAGTFQVKLTVTDNAGGTTTLTQPVTVTAPPPNKAPTASFTSAVTDLAATVDGTGSADPDGTIAAYAWDFGDGSTGTGVTASRTYAAAGTYTVMLTVTDDNGATAQTSRSVTVTAPPPPNQVPEAAFTATPTNLAVAFDGSTSKDSDGSIAAYAWEFGDGTTGTGATPAHTYAGAGPYQVKLTVTDNAGATAATAATVTVAAAPAANQAPVAAFTSSGAGLAATFDGSGSSDPDGSIAGYAWDFGDGTTGTGTTPTHPYATADTYQVKLTVTDNKGASTSVTKPVTVAQGQNQAPTAAFTSSVNNLGATFDGSGSADPDGTIASYAWDFGDGTTGAGVKPAHTYGAGGTFPVTLTVTDNGGAATSITNPVTVAPAPAGVFASDEFGRTLAAGWGTADQGGAWTVAGSTSNFAVGAGAGTIKLAAAGAGPTVWLNGVAQADVDTTVDVKLDKAATGGGTYFSLAERRTGTNDYRLKVRAIAGGTVSAQLTKVVGGTETAVGNAVNVAGLTFNAGDTLRLRFQVSGTGTATLSGKVWKVGSTEPAWQVTGTDGTAGLQTAGGVGLVPYLSGSSTNAPVTVTVDNLTMTAPR